MTVLSIYYERNFPALLDAAVRDRLCRYFPNGVETFKDSRAWHGSVPLFSIVAQDAGAPIGHAGVVDRTVTVGESHYRVAGLQNVYVAPEERGKGLNAEIVRLAMTEAERAGFDFGLLFCISKLADAYAKCGWWAIPDTQVIRREDGKELPLPDDHIVMFYPLKVTAMPHGPVDLNGNDW